MLELCYHPRDICLEIFGEYNTRNSQFLSNIKSGDSWSHISKEYDINKKQLTSNFLTNNQAHLICQCICNGLDNDEIAIQLGYDTNNIDEKMLKKIRGVISGIRRKDYYTYISCDYDFGIYGKRKARTFSDEDIHLIGQSLQDGKSTDEILTLLGYDLSTLPKEEKPDLVNKISKIRCRKFYTNITSQYNW